MRRLAEEDQKNIVFASFFVLGWQRERERDRETEREGEKECFSLFVGCECVIGR